MFGKKKTKIVFFYIFLVFLPLSFSTFFCLLRSLSSTLFLLYIIRLPKQNPFFIHVNMNFTMKELFFLLFFFVKCLSTFCYSLQIRIFIFIFIFTFFNHVIYFLISLFLSLFLVLYSLFDRGVPFI